MGFMDMFRTKKLINEINNLKNEVERLKRYEMYREVEDVEEYVNSAKATAALTVSEARTEADDIIQDAKKEASTILKNASISAEKIVTEAKDKADRILQEAETRATWDEILAKDAREKASKVLSEAEDKAIEIASRAKNRADEIVNAAQLRAVEIGHEAIFALEQEKELKSAVAAMKNAIEGYGDEYIIPTFSLLDDLADEFGYDEAGKKLREARENTRLMISANIAAECEYVEERRKTTAIRFVLDAFNGKVDSILSKTKHNNYGKQKQAILDAYSLVNYNGRAFRSAKITPEYLDSRLEELRWACVAQELKRLKAEEQREFRERMREEERARKEYEKAIRDAEKEEALLHKAMDKARKAMEVASDEMRSQYEARFIELQDKLKAAEEKNQRALSMAQQTRAGNVYIISNIGSFGDDVFKVGMTRRLNPEDRVKELGDASVPFPFDIHGIIYSTDAPALEKAMHDALRRTQMNKANNRKEFFKTSLQNIKAITDRMQLETTWTMVADALEYRETVKIEELISKNPAVREEWERSMIHASAEDGEALKSAIA